MKGSTERRGYAAALLAVGIWSGFILVSRAGGTSTLTPYDMVALRFATAGLVLLPAALRRRGRLADPRLWVLTAAGGVGYTLLAFHGFARSPASHAAVLLPGLMPFVMALWAWPLLGERPSRRRWIALGLTAAGVACLGAEIVTGSAALRTGDSLLMGAALCWGLYTVLVRRWGFSPWDVTAGVGTLTALLYLPVYWLWLPGRVATASWGEVALQAGYQGVLAAVVQMLLYMYAATTIGPTRLGVIMALVPVAAGIAAVPVLGEPLTAGTSAGLLLVSAGTVWAHRERGGRDRERIRSEGGVRHATR